MIAVNHAYALRHQVLNHTKPLRCAVHSLHIPLMTSPALVMARQSSRRPGSLLRFTARHNSRLSNQRKALFEHDKGIAERKYRKPELFTSYSTITENPLPNFDDSKAAYETKSTRELLRAAVSFGLCRVPVFVRHAEPLLRTTRWILGDYLTDQFLKATLFGHFCAGEDETEIQKPIQALQRAGIGSIFDFAAEDDIPQTGASGGYGSGTTSSSSSAGSVDTQPTAADAITSDQPPIVRVYDYESEAKCDRHVSTFKKCIQDVATLQPDGFAAVKITALCNPKLLERMSRAIVEAQNLFAKFDVNRDGFISRQEFEQGFHLFFKDDTVKLKDMMEQLVTPSDDDKMIDYITWSMLLRPEDLPSITSGCREIGPLALATPTDEEMELISKLYERGHALAQHAAKYGTRLLIDAEQTRFQPAIDSLVLDLQRNYNTGSTDFPIIYHTYQCYLKEIPERLRTDLERSRRFGYHFGAKLVRGAYMESERALAAAFGYPSPIHDTIEETHQCYDQSVETLLKHSVQQSEQKVEVMLATHNQDSVETAVKVMNELGVDRRDSVVSFGQLYGMKDNLTYNLGQHGFRAYKYVPYGEVKMVMPYLIRRANENASIAGSAHHELSLIVQELSRRITGRRRPFG